MTSELLPEEEIGDLPSGKGTYEPDGSSKDGRSARQVIAAFQATLASQKSYLFRYTYSKHVEYHALSAAFVRPNLEGVRKGYAAGLLATDGYRVVHLRNTWGAYHSRERPLSPSDPNYYATTFDGNEMWKVNIGPRRYTKKRIPGREIVDRNRSSVEGGFRHSWLEDMKRISHTNSLQGYLGRLGRVDKLFRNAHILDLREYPEQIGDSMCEVIDFDSPYGTGTLWFDPAHGYLLAQAEVYHDTARHLGRTGKKTDAGYSKSCLLTDASFASVEGIWFATAATVAVEVQTPDYYDFTTHWPEITKIVVNPDLDAYRFFSGDDLPNGTLVVYPNPRNPRSRRNVKSYVWQDGRQAEITPENDPRPH